MTLKDVIDRLRREDPTRVVRSGFGRPHSWRGIYADIAFDPACDVTIGSMLAHAESANGATFTGWKGGAFLMDLGTDCHIAEEGDYHGDEDALTTYRLEAMLAPPPAPDPRDAEIARLRHELDEANGACFLNANALRLQKARADAAKARCARLEAIQKIARVQVDDKGDLWLHLDGGQRYKASFNVTAKLTFTTGAIAEGVREATEAIRALLAPAASPVRLDDAGETR